MRPLRYRRPGIGTNRPSSEDRSSARARRPGSSPRAGASPLRDSAGFAPASLGSAPSRATRDRGTLPQGPGGIGQDGRPGAAQRPVSSTLERGDETGPMVTQEPSKIFSTAGSGPRRRSRSRTSTRWSGGSRPRSWPRSTRGPRLCLESGRPAVGRAARRGLHRRAAPRDHVLVRGAGQLRRLRARGVRPGDHPRVRAARGRPDPQVLLRDHAGRDEPRGVLPARDRQARARRPDGLEATTDLERAAHNNIGWLYHNGGRYWSGYSKARRQVFARRAVHHLPDGRGGRSTLFLGMSKGTTHPVFKRDLPTIGQDESRHLRFA